MSKLKSTIKWLLPLCLLSACAPAMLPQQPPRPAPGLQALNTPERGLTSSTYRYSADQTELTIIMQYDNGETHENSVTRRPLGGNTVSAETVVKRGASVVRRHQTRADEAQLALKVAANNGWREVYNDLRARYQLAGLL